MPEEIYLTEEDEEILDKVWDELDKEWDGEDESAAFAIDKTGRDHAPAGSGRGGQFVSKGEGGNGVPSDTESRGGTGRGTDSRGASSSSDSRTSREGRGNRRNDSSEEPSEPVQSALKPRMVTARGEYTTPVDVEVVPENLRKYLISPDGSEHQLEGAAKTIEAIDKAGGMLLADGAGAGKTRQMLAVAQTYAQRGKKSVMVAPAAIINPDWSEGVVVGSIGKDSAAMGINLQLNRGDKPINSGEVHVTTYESLFKMKDQIDNDTVVIFDEAHGLKNATSARSKHGNEISSKALGVVYGSATPADNPRDIAYTFRTKLFGDKPWEEVRKQFSVKKFGAAKVLGDTASMFDDLTKQGLMLKREISLDGVEAKFDHIQLSEEDKSALTKIETDIAPELKGQILMRQRFAQEKLKIPHTVNMINDELKEGRKVVVFVAGVSGEEGQLGTAGQLKAALSQFGINSDEIEELHGGEESGGDEAVQKFQKGNARVLITTAQSGGTGHNFDDTIGDTPRTQIIMTAPFSAIDNSQIWGRTHRLTTRSPSRIRYVFADTNVDRWNANLIRGKVASLGAIVGGEAAKQNIPDIEQQTQGTPSLSTDEHGRYHAPPGTERGGQFISKEEAQKYEEKEVFRIGNWALFRRSKKKEVVKGKENDPGEPPSTPPDTSKRYVSVEYHKEVVEKAIKKAEKTLNPTEDEKKEAKEGIEKKGAHLYRKDLVGNTKNRRTRRNALLREFGDGKECPCIFCGLLLTHGTLEQDKIIPTKQGGRYRLHNLVPACSDCNKKKGNIPFDEAIKKVVNYNAGTN